MLSILDRYLGRAVLGGTLLTLAVLLPLLAFFLLADEIDQLEETRYGLSQALFLVALSLPRYAYQLFPIATLIGALVGLGKLASDSELVAMRAAGVSIARILSATFKAGSLLVLFALFLGEGIAPQADQRALQLRSQLQSGQITLRTRQGFWAKDGNAYVNIREILSGTRLREITLYELNAQQNALVQTTQAREAQYEQGHWVLKDILRSQIGESGVQVRFLREAAWESLLSPALLQVVILEPQLLPVWDLWRYVRFMEASGQAAGRYGVVLWNKLVYPFLLLALLFLAIPILFGSARSAGLGKRVFMGVLVGIGFYVVSRTFTYLALLYGMSAWLAAVLPPLLFVSGGLGVLYRLR